jgi:hypothetical protein
MTTMAARATTAREAAGGVTASAAGATATTHFTSQRGRAAMAATATVATMAKRTVDANDPACTTQTCGTRRTATATVGAIHKLTARKTGAAVAT